MAEMLLGPLGSNLKIDSETDADSKDVLFGKLFFNSEKIVKTGSLNIFSDFKLIDYKADLGMYNATASLHVSEDINLGIAAMNQAAYLGTNNAITKMSCTSTNPNTEFRVIIQQGTVGYGDKGGGLAMALFRNASAGDDITNTLDQTGENNVAALVKLY